jgi:hypothetical protein
MPIKYKVSVLLDPLDLFLLSSITNIGEFLFYRHCYLDR